MSSGPSDVEMASRDAKPKDAKDAKGKKKQEEELPEDERKVRDDMQLLVERTQDPDEGVQRAALETMSTELRGGSGTLTSVPLQLKFLRKHYDALRTLYGAMRAGENKRVLADILSMLATTIATAPGDSLKFKLEGHAEQVAEWGNEYIRFLCGELSREYDARTQVEDPADARPVDDLLALVSVIVPFQFKHNAEPEAIDLLHEVEQLPRLIDLCDEDNYVRVCSYLLSLSSYLVEPEDTDALKVALEVYLKLQKYPDALRVALRLNLPETIRRVFDACDDELIKKQLGFMLARQRFLIDVEHPELNDIISNTKLSEYFRKVAENLEVTEAKEPEDVFKSHLVENRARGAADLDSAKQNLAATIVNGFLNAGFGTDKLMSGAEGDAARDNWLYKNKDVGMTAAAASVGMIHMWDVYTGIAEIDRYVESSDRFIRGGGLMGMGLVLNGVRSDFDPAFNLIMEHMRNGTREVRVSGILGLGLAYAGSFRQDVANELTTLVVNTDESVEISAYAALSLGLIFVGSCNEDVAETILQTLLERSETELTTNSLSRFFSLALGLVFLGKQDMADTMLEATRALPAAISKYCELTVEACAYAGTGNVLKVQKLMEECGQHYDDEAAQVQQGVAVLGMSLVAMGEHIGTEMITRSYDHLLQYGDIDVRRGVPLALGLLSVSNPKINIMDTLSKLSHDNDPDVSMGAILGLGLIGAGTNNSRIAGLLRQLSSYYQREANHLFMVRVAQGLLHMGKGTITLQPFHSDRFLMSPVAVAGLLVVMHASLDFKNLLVGKHPYLFFHLACAMYPRFLVSVDENLEMLPASVRVGVAVDTVAQAGRPRSITGFQTHDTPVLLQHGERAELATDEFEALTSLLEGVVILRKNEESTAAASAAAAAK